jgi:hypothetical protein
LKCFLLILFSLVCEIVWMDMVLMIPSLDPCRQPYL